MNRVRIAFDSAEPFVELHSWREDEQLLARASACITAQREAAVAARERFVPNPNAEQDVSPQTLEAILEQGRDVHGIARDRSISNVIPFNSRHLEGAVNSSEVAHLRDEVDRLVARKLRETFDTRQNLDVTCSGHFWYPPGGYMGWHTNSGSPGWRIYLTHVDEPGQSFFRYRHPHTRQIITSMDQTWDVRLFRIHPDAPLWHTVYSQTNRFSLGYVVHPRRPLDAVKRRLRRWLGVGV